MKHLKFMKRNGRMEFPFPDFMIFMVKAPWARGGFLGNMRVGLLRVSAHRSSTASSPRSSTPANAGTTPPRPTTTAPACTTRAWRWRLHV